MRHFPNYGRNEIHPLHQNHSLRFEAIKHFDLCRWIFGISKLITEEKFLMTIGVGTNKFMGPEIIAEEDYNEKVDVYSFGVLVFYTLSGGQLPKIKTPQIFREKKAEIPSSFTEFAKDLIND